RNDARQTMVLPPPGFLHEPDNLGFLPRRRPTLRRFPTYAEARILIRRAIVHRGSHLPQGTPDLHRPVRLANRLHHFQRVIPRVDVLQGYRARSEISEDRRDVVPAPLPILAGPRRLVRLPGLSTTEAIKCLTEGATRPDALWRR